MRFAVDLKPSDSEAAVTAMARQLDGTVTYDKGRRIIEYEAQDKADATRKLRGAGQSIVGQILSGLFG